MYTVDEMRTMPEGQLFDRKSARVLLPKLAEAIVGFANADGELLLLA